MQVQVNDWGERVNIYSPYIDEQETARNVSIFIPESSHNSGLYFVEPVDHLTGNSSAGLFTDSAASSNFWWNLTPGSKTNGSSYAYTLPSTYTSPQNMFLRQNYIKPAYKKMWEIYGHQQRVGPGGYRNKVMH